MNTTILFEIDDEGEATGVIRPFCSDECRDSFDRGDGCYVSAEDDVIEHFGFVPRCEGCGDLVTPDDGGEA